MAERRSEMTAQIPAAARWRSRAVVAVATIALLGAHGLGGPPAPPVVLPGRSRLARVRIVGSFVAAIPGPASPILTFLFDFGCDPRLSHGGADRR